MGLLERKLDKDACQKIANKIEFDLIRPHLHSGNEGFEQYNEWRKLLAKRNSTNNPTVSE